ncbi:hypothetical protein [Kribbella sp. NPDC006257]|uniref:hypothetical protein n=1 Tax=Kribbella sp. NPDC006257 TaxID=3156738 RepID=UPI0033BC0E53
MDLATDLILSLYAADPILDLYAAPPGTPGAPASQLVCADPLEYLVRPLVRVFRRGLDLYGVLLVDAGSPLTEFELDDGGAPTGRVVISVQERLLHGPADLLAIPGAEEVVRGELRFLGEAAAELLGADERWAPYVHSVPLSDQLAVRDAVELVKEREAARRRGKKLAAPVVRYLGPRPPGWSRFAAELFHLGGRLSDQPEEVVAELKNEQLERVPAGWGHEPATSHVTTLSALPLGELRPSPLAMQRAVKLSEAQTGALIARLVTAAHRSAAATAEKVLRATNDSAEAIHQVIQQRQFRAGARSHYRLTDLRNDLGTGIARGEPLRLSMTFFATKHHSSRLKAAGPLPDLAELAMLVRIVELVETLRIVYPPGVLDFSLIADGEHFRPHPGHRFADGLQTMNRYVEAVGADFVRIEDVEELATRRYESQVLRGHAERKTDLRTAYERIFEGLDIADDPLGTLRRAGALDPLQNFVALFRSLVFSVPVNGSVSSQQVFADLYEVGPAEPAELRATRQAVLRAGWAAALEYLSTSVADAEYGYLDDLVPGSLRFTQRARPGRAAFGPLSGASVAPCHGTGVIDARGIVTIDFLVALLDQGFVPLYSPLLGDEQPFAMVPAGTADVVEVARMRTR